MYEPYVVFYFRKHGKGRSIEKLAECNSLESARKLVKKKSKGAEVTYPWDGHTEGYEDYIIDRGNYI